MASPLKRAVFDSDGRPRTRPLKRARQSTRAPLRPTNLSAPHPLQALPPTVDYAGPVIAAQLAPEPPRVVGSPVVWGFYLACSWTWVIGMYLPTLLVRDYGLWGWVTFALPNVVGAAAMGWVLRSREATIRIARDHKAAVFAFSAVTVSFQIYVLMWLVPRLAGVFGIVLVLPALLLAASVPLAGLVGRRGVAVAVWLCSLLVFLGLWSAGVLTLPAATGTQPTWHLAGLAPACLFGFALCPYLDATFLRARAHTDARGARIAFGVGFGLFFLAMILGTLLYSVWVIGGGLATALGWVLVAHLTLQVGFTVAAHTSAAGTSPLTLVGIVAAAVLGMAAMRADLGDVRLLGLSLGEHVYRGYLGFYGLIFPAYVLLVIVGRKSLLTYGLTVLAALPLFALGFLKRDMPLSAAGVGLVLLAWWLLPATAVQPRQAT